MVKRGDESTLVKRHLAHSRAEFDAAVGSALFGKAPGTLVTRLRALLSFKKWSQERSFEHVPTYASVKAYLIFLRETKAAPTTGQTFREALSVVDGSCQTGGPFLLRTCAGTLLFSTDSRFSSTASFLNVRLHQRFIIFVFRDGNTVWTNKRFYHLRLRPVLVCELGSLILPDKAKVTCLFG